MQTPEKPPAKMNKAEANRALFAIMLLTLLSVAGIAMPFPILTPLMLDTPDNQLSQFMGIHPNILLAIILATYPLGMFIGSSFIGSLSDIYGRRKVLVLTTLLSALSYAFAAFAIVQESFLLLLTARIITGVCEGNVSVARTMTTDLHPVIDKTRSMSLVYAVMYSGWLIGPLMGGYMMLLGADIAFILAGMLMLVALTVVILFIPETNTASQQDKHKGSYNVLQLAIRSNSLTLLRHSKIRHLFIQYLLIMLGLNAFYEFYPVWLVQSFNFDSVGIGHATAVVTFFMILSSLLVLEKLKNRLTAKNVIILGLSVFGILQFFTLSMDDDFLYPFFAISGAFIALFNVLMPLFYSERFSQGEPGKMFGLTTSTFCLGSFIIALVGGVISVKGAAWTLITGGVLTLMGMLYFIWLFRTDMEESEEDLTPAEQEQ